MTNTITTQTSNNNTRYLVWFRLPTEIKLTLYAVIPIIFAQILQKLYPVVDNHYITALGSQALLIHNIQFSFIALGQYVGTATAISFLILWKRIEYANSQKSVFAICTALYAFIAVLSFTIIICYTDKILSHFSVPVPYYHVAKIYFQLGLLNMVLQGLFIALMGIMIASNKEKLSLIFSLVLLILNITADSAAIHFLFSGAITPEHIFPAMLLIVISTSTFLAICIAIIITIIIKETHGWERPNIREIFKIWTNELGSALINGIYPILYALQLGVVKSSSSLLITYQLLLQLTTVLCIPLMATMQISLRNAAEEKQDLSSVTAPQWWRQLLYCGLFPTQILLLLFVLFPFISMHAVFGYVVPTDHTLYVRLFLFASMIGQVGNALTVPVRARKKSHLVTTAFFITCIIVMLGGMQLTIFFGIATPVMTGVVTLIFTIVYFSILLYCTSRG